MFSGEDIVKKNLQTAIVTGASRGIGKAIAKELAYNGCNVLINYNNSRQEAQMVVDSLKEKGCHAELFKADVSKKSEVERMIAHCLKVYGKIDILVNNAGIAQTKLFTDITEEDWDSMMDINLKGIYNCTQSVLKYMLDEKHGKIINISSIWGIAGASCEVHYSASKAAVIGLTKALAKELGPSNIQVNCIAPGIIDTDMMEGYSNEEIEDLKDSTPLLRLGKPEDIAKCALFLASEASDFITGQVISPNGGFVI